MTEAVKLSPAERDACLYSIAREVSREIGDDSGATWSGHGNPVLEAIADAGDRLRRRHRLSDADDVEAMTRED